MTPCTGDHLLICRDFTRSQSGHPCAPCPAPGRVHGKALPHGTGHHRADVLVYRSRALAVNDRSSGDRPGLLYSGGGQPCPASPAIAGASPGRVRAGPYGRRPGHAKRAEPRNGSTLYISREITRITPDLIPLMSTAVAVPSFVPLLYHDPALSSSLKPSGRGILYHEFLQLSS